MICKKVKQAHHQLAKKGSLHKLSKRTHCSYKRYQRNKKKLRRLKSASRTFIKIIIPPQASVITNPNKPNYSTVPTPHFTVVTCVEVHRYFYIVHESVHLSNPLVIPAHLFINDSGHTANQFIFYNPSGYMNLYINAVMQQGDIYSVTSNELTIKPTGQTIYGGTAIIIESVVFSSKFIPINLS